MEGKRVLQFGFFALALAAAAAAQVTPAPANLRYQPQGGVLLHDSVGSTQFTLINEGSSPAPLALRAGRFTDDVTGAALTSPQVAFTEQSGAALPPLLAAGSRIVIQVKISNATGASVATTELFNGNAELGRLHLVQSDAPLNIQVSGAGGYDQQLVLTNHQDSVLTLRNEDLLAYPLEWSFQIGGKTLQSGDLQIAPHGSAQIDLMPESDLYLWKDSLRPSAKAAMLRIRLNGPPEVPRDLLPQRTLRVNVLMRSLSPGLTSFLWHLFVALLLLIGGLLSVVANTALPNMLRKSSLRRALDALSERTTAMSMRGDSYLRGLISMERRRIDLLLKHASVFSLASAEKLDEVAAALEQLRKRMKMAERLEDLRRRLEDGLPTAPPSVTEAIEDKLKMAATQLQPVVLTPEDVVAANGYMEAANAALESLSNPSVLAVQIAAKFQELKARQKLFPDSYYADLAKALPGMFEVLNQPFDDPASITPSMMFAIDFGIAALHLAFDYCGLRAGAPAADIPGFAAGQSARERLQAHHDEFVALLGTLSRGALRDLRILVQEMRENIYERDLLEEIAARGRAEIALEPQIIRPFAPVVFSIRFKDSRFNHAAAIQRLTCKWEFPNHLQEREWKACHFFQGNERSRDEDGGVSHGVEVAVRVESQRPSPSAAPGEDRAAIAPLRSVLSTTLDIQRGDRSSSSRALAEGVRFFIVFGVTLAALFAGALQQVDKLDFIPAVIAVLALGFGADTIKNLLTQTARKAAV